MNLIYWRLKQMGGETNLNEYHHCISKWKINTYLYIYCHYFGF